MRVRTARPSDVEAIVSGAVRFAAERYPDDEPDPAHMASVVGDLVDSDALALVLEGANNEFAGCYLGATIANLISGKPVAVEILFWVEPKFRGHGRSLLAYVEDWARSQGCGSAVLSRPETAERAGKVFEAWGYVPCERHYRKVL